MGTLANSVFQTLMGWIRTLCSEIWNTVTSPGNTTMLSWIGSHWKVLALLLCAGGMITDLIVYLFRWQPYRVWRSFFRRIIHGREEENEAFMQQDEPEYNQPDPDTYISRNDYPEQTTGQEETLSSEQEGNIQAWSRNEPEGTTETFEQAILPRRRKVTRLFTEPGEENYATPDQLIDRNEAYRRPVYPRRWKAEEGDQGERG